MDTTCKTNTKNKKSLLWPKAPSARDLLRDILTSAHHRAGAEDDSEESCLERDQFRALPSFPSKTQDEKQRDRRSSISSLGSDMSISSIIGQAAANQGSLVDIEAGLGTTKANHDSLNMASLGTGKENHGSLDMAGLGVANHDSLDMASLGRSQAQKRNSLVQDIEAGLRGSKANHDSSLDMEGLWKANHSSTLVGISETAKNNDSLDMAGLNDNTHGEEVGKDEGPAARRFFVHVPIPLHVIVPFGGQGGFTPPVFPKSSSELSFITSYLNTSFIFQNLPDNTIDSLALAFEKVECPQNCTIIKQGDPHAEYFYLLASGECKVIVDDKALPEPYGTLSEGISFGELSLLYDQPRSATITAKVPATLYRLNQQTFKHFIDSQQIRDLEANLRRVDETINVMAGVNTRYNGSIIHKFKPKRSWLLRRWKGTVLQFAWKTAVANMLFTLALCLAMHYGLGNDWEMGMPPDPSHPVIARMIVFGTNWNYLMTLTTFILTFYLSQSYALWGSIYMTTRVVQGRINDGGLLLATLATRDKESGEYTPKAEEVLDDVASYFKLFHVFMWAQYASDLQPILTPWGMSRLLSRGLITKEQYETLKKLKDARPQFACLEWAIIRTMQGTENGSLKNEFAMKQVFLLRMTELRAAVVDISDILDGRMPLAYTHFVQLLVDTFLITAPFTLYAQLGIWSVLYVGILTLFYSGLLDLAKMFLDPFDNDDFYKESINMDIGVLVRETNGHTTQLKKEGSILPFNSYDQNSKKNT